MAPGKAKISRLGEGGGKPRWAGSCEGGLLESQGGRSGSESPAGQQLLTRKLAAANCILRISQIPKLNLSDLARYCHQVSQPKVTHPEDGYVRFVL